MHVQCYRSYSKWQGAGCAGNSLQFINRHSVLTSESNLLSAQCGLEVFPKFKVALRTSLLRPSNAASQ